MSTVGRSNIEITADTRRARRTLGDFFREAESSGRQFTRVLNALDPFVNIERDSRTASGSMGNLQDAARRLDSNLNDLGGNNDLDGLNSDLTNAERNMDDLTDSTRQVGDGMDDATREVRDFGDAADRESRNAEGSFGKMAGTAKKIGGLLVAVFAVDQLKDFGTELAATAGAAEASKAQFSTVFGDMEGEAAKRLSAIGGEATILENRMKDSFTKIAAFAKTGGMDTADSLDLADRSMRAVADSAAFYDRSLEDTTESLQSFLKGNFENDAALGLSSTETTRNAAANDLYGKSFKDLSEAQKQLTSLQMVEDANKLTGALGQASRESDGWENVVGNMTQAWTDFKGEIGAPVLKVAVAGIKGITTAVQSLNTEAIGNGIGKAFDFISDSIKKAKDALAPFVEGVKGVANALKGLMTDDGQAGRDILKGMGFSEETIMMLDGYAAKIGEFRHYIGDFIDGIKGLFQDDGQIGRDLLASVGLSPELIQTLDDYAANFSAFRNEFSEVLASFKALFKGDANAKDMLENLGFTPNFINKAETIMSTVKTIGGVLKDVFVIAMPLIKSSVLAIISFLLTNFSKVSKFWSENGPQILSAVTNVFKGIMTVIKFIMPFVLAIIKSVWGNIKGVITGALDIIMGVVKIFSGLFTGDFKKMWEGVKQLFFGAVNFIWNFIQLTFYGKILGGAKAFILAFKGGFSTMWGALKTLFSGSVTGVWTTIKTGWSKISTETIKVFKNIWSFLSGIFKAITSVVTFAVKGYFNIIRGGWSLIFNTTKNIFLSVFNFLKGIFTSIRTSISGSVSSILTKVRDTWSALKTNTTGAFRDIYNGIKTKFTDIVNLAKGLPRRIGDGIGSMASKVTSGVTTVINKLATTLGKGVNGVIGGINWVLGKIGVDKDIPKWEVPQYAQGTKGHPGGPMIVGDGKFNNSGPELMRRPNGDMMLSPDKPTLMNGEKGTHVWSAKETRAILANIPKYENGTIGKAKDAITHLWDKGKSGGKKLLDKAIDVFDYIKEPSKLLDVAIKALGIEKPSGSGFIGNMAKGGWNKVKSGAVDFVRSKLADFGDDGGPAPGFGRLFGKSSSYGFRMHPILKKRIFHNGADYPAPTGTLIKAQAAGKVIQAAYHAVRGNFVKIKSGIMERIYQHNSKNLVDTGDMVRQGQGIGTVGSTGRSTGPHLHYEVKKNGKNINPQGFFKGGIVKMKQLAWIAEKGMEAIIPLETNRAEGLDLWRRVGEHFGFNMDSLLNSADHSVSFAGAGQSNLPNLAASGNRLSSFFTSAAGGQQMHPLYLTVQIPLDKRILAEETFEITSDLIDQKKDVQNIGRGRRL